MIPFPIIFYSSTSTEPNISVSSFLNVEAKETSKRPIYYRFKNVIFRDKVYKALYLSLFWKVNPGYSLLGTTIGKHGADVERIVILYDDDTPEWVYFGAHSYREGQWVEYKKCEKTPDNKLKVYVSPQSHGMYPQKLTYCRLFGFANESCSHCTQPWEPQPDDFCDATKQTWSDTHYQVIRGVNSPMNAVDPGVNSITSFQRFALPLYKSKLEKVTKIRVL